MSLTQGIITFPQSFPLICSIKFDLFPYNRKQGFFYYTGKENRSLETQKSHNYIRFTLLSGLFEFPPTAKFLPKTVSLITGTEIGNGYKNSLRLHSPVYKIRKANLHCSRVPFLNIQLQKLNSMFSDVKRTPFYTVTFSMARNK